MRVLLGVVLYNPSEEEIEKIKNYSKYKLINDIYVYDNSEERDAINFPEKVFYIKGDTNVGLAVPYNLMLSYAHKKGCEYLCILDQDSFYEEEEISKMISYIESNHELLTNVGIIAPYWDVREKIETEQLVERKYVINSGSFISVGNMNKYGISYDEKLFLDGLDFDFCWSIREKGLKVYQLENVRLIHHLGEMDYTRGFSRHSANRYYLIAHNKKYIWKKHNGFPGLVVAQASNIRLLVKILIYESNRTNKLISCLKGIIA